MSWEPGIKQRPSQVQAWSDDSVMLPVLTVFEKIPDSVNFDSNVTLLCSVSVDPWTPLQYNVGLQASPILTQTIYVNSKPTCFSSGNQTGMFEKLH